MTANVLLVCPPPPGVGGGVDEMDESDQEAEAAGLGAGSSGRQAAGQNVGLYNEIGQHNPKKAKAGVLRYWCCCTQQHSLHAQLL